MIARNYYPEKRLDLVLAKRKSSRVANLQRNLGSQRSGGIAFKEAPRMILCSCARSLNVWTDLQNLSLSRSILIVGAIVLVSHEAQDVLASHICRLDRWIAISTSSGH